MGETEIRKCPKCGGKMNTGETLVGYGVWGFRLRKKADIVGDKIIAFYCEDCGFIELYKEMNERKG